MKTKYRTISDGVIRITNEKYKNVAVSIGRVSIDSSKEDEAKLSYEYDVVDLPEDEDIKLDEEFEITLGDIIVDIIETKLKDDPGSLRFTDAD